MIAACLIVRDAAATIAACLASLRPYVDEVNVYDTGSTDGTLALLDRLAADPGPPLRVERGEWRDDFAWAREQSFAMASPDADWLLWIDADDILEGGSNLRGIVGFLDADVSCLVATYVYGFDRARGELVVESRERIVRRGSGYRWTGRVHETLDPPEGEELAFAVVSPWMLRWLHRHDRRPGEHLERNERLQRIADANGERRMSRSVLSDADRAAIRARVEASRRSTLGRNDPCWCRSGRKLKSCHRDRPWEPILVRPADMLHHTAGSAR